MLQTIGAKTFNGNLKQIKQRNMNKVLSAHLLGALFYLSSCEGSSRLDETESRLAQLESKAMEFERRLHEQDGIRQEQDAQLNEIQLKLDELLAKSAPSKSQGKQKEKSETSSDVSIQDFLTSVYDDEEKFCNDPKYVRFDIKTGDGVKYNTCLFPSKYAKDEKVNPLAFYTYRTGLPSGYSKDCYDVVNLREKRESTYGRSYPVTQSYVRFIKGSNCVESSKVDTSTPVPIDLTR